MYNILVTGCGGDIGQSIGKILKSNPMFSKVLGCDIHNEHAGKFIFDVCHIIPGCRSDSYLPTLQDIIQKFEIDIVIPSSEPEIRFFAERQFNNELFGKPLILANAKALEVGLDKYLTARFLESVGLVFPETHLVQDVKTPKFPLIMKSRNGSGSKSVFVIKEIDEFNFYSTKFPHFIIQEFLENENEEYTCGLFGDAKGEIRIIAYRRKLVGGFSGFGTVVRNSSIDNLLLDLAKKMELRGSINVQLRMTDKGPFIFEINPRFSSTVMFRHMMGFQDVIWCIQDRLNLQISSYSPPETGKNFYKGYNEYIA